MDASEKQFLTLPVILPPSSKVFRFEGKCFSEIEGHRDKHLTYISQCTHHPVLEVIREFRLRNELPEWIFPMFSSQEEQRTCNKCKSPLCLGDFTKIVDLKKSALHVYVQKDEGASSQTGYNNKKKNVFILHNASDKDLKRPDYIKEMCQYRTRCVQCKEFIHRVRSLLDEIKDIKQNDVIGVCEHCNRHNPSGTCKRCEYFVKKFKASQTTQQMEKREQFKSWLCKVNLLIQGILDSKDVCTTTFYNEPSTYLKDLLTRLQKLESDYEENPTNIMQVPEVRKSASNDEIIRVLEELLLKGKYDDSLKLLHENVLAACESKIVSQMGCCRFMESVAKEKKKLEELLTQIKHESDLRLSSKMRAFERSDSAAVKNMLLLSQLEPFPDKVLNKDTNFYTISSNLRNKTTESDARFKEHSFNEFIQAMPQTDKYLDESALGPKTVRDKTSLAVLKDKHKVLKKEEFNKLKTVTSKEKSEENKSRLNFEKTKSVKEKSGLPIKEKSGLRDLRKSKLINRKEKENDETQFIDTKEINKKQGQKHDILTTEKDFGTGITKPKKRRDSIDLGKQRITKFTIHDSTNNIVLSKVGLSCSNENKRNKIEETKQFVKFRREAPTIIQGAKLVTLGKLKKHPDDIATPYLYRKYEIKDFEGNLPPIYKPTIIISNANNDLKTNISPRLKGPGNSSHLEGGFVYKLSDREYVNKGWTILPKSKTMRQVHLHKMEPATQCDWFENNKEKKTKFYDSGQKLAEINDDGHGRWFYKNGEVALDFRNKKGCPSAQRYVVYSCSDDLDLGKASPRTVLASFDYAGNGVVYDRFGNERLKYNQYEGILLDEKVSPMTRWKWHSLDEPPDLENCQIDNYVNVIDPRFEEISKKTLDADPRMPRDQREVEPQVQSIEREKINKCLTAHVAQKYEPYKIRVKALRINDCFSLRVLDQGNIYVLFREGSINLKVNVGMKLVNEVIDTEKVDVAEVLTPYNRQPALTQSLENIRRSVDKAKKMTKMRTERAERLLMPPKLSRSAYDMGIGVKVLGHCPVRRQVPYSSF